MSRTVLYPPTLDWDFLFQRPQQIMLQFAKNGWKVLYCNKTQKKGKRPSEISNNLYIYYSWKSLLQDYSNIGVDVFYSTWAVNYKLIDYIRAKVIVYDRLDDFKETSRYESSMIQKSDLVLNTSQILYEKSKKLHNNIILVPNACDYAFISKNTECPQELASLKRPIVCFIGALGRWVDTELIEKVADRYTTVLIGPEFGKKVPNNVIYLGIKDYKHLPAYYQHIDIGIIPFLNSDEANAANPIKMYEYLAAGKIVVSTPIPEAVSCPVVGVADRDNFINAIKIILDSDTETKHRKRLEFSKNNTWEHRFDLISSNINRVFKFKGMK